MATAEERETTITTSDADDVVRIWTGQRTYITKLRKNTNVREIKTGFFEGSEWAEFEVDSDKWNPVSGVKRAVNMTPEQRAATGERLRAAQGPSPALSVG